MKSALFAAITAYISSKAAADEAVLDSICIMEGPRANEVTEELLFATESDLGNFALMGQTEKEYSVPHSLQICHDGERIYGLQLTLGFHRAPFEGEDELIEKYGKQDYIEQLDEQLRTAQPRRMEFVGTQVGKCEFIMLNDDGLSLPQVTVYADEDGIRALKLLTQNRETHDYKELNFGGQIPIGEATMTGFEAGRVMLGIIGTVSYDPNDGSQDRLRSLGFYQNMCARTRQRYFSAEFNAKVEAGEWGGERHIDKEKLIEAEHWLEGAAGVLIILYVIFSTILLCYCCIINRAKICKRKQAGGQAGQSDMQGGELANSVDITPANIPQPDQQI